MNKVVLQGRFTHDHDIRYSKTSEPMAILTNSLAVAREFKKDEADFISVKAFGKTAENISKFFKKGNLILVSGRIQTGSYENNAGHKIYTTDVIIESFNFTGEKRDGGSQRDNRPAQSQDAFSAIGEPVDDEDLPF